MTIDLNEEKNHAILIEKIAFLIDYYGVYHCSHIFDHNMTKRAVKEWNRNDIKNTPYGKRLFNFAEKISRLKLKE